MLNELINGGGGCNVCVLIETMEAARAPKRAMTSPKKQQHTKQHMICTLICFFKAKSSLFSHKLSFLWRVPPTKKHILNPSSKCLEASLIY